MKRFLLAAMCCFLFCLAACVKPHPPAEPVPTAAPTATVVPTQEPTVGPTETPTVAPTETPVPTPIPVPTETPTPTPTLTPEIVSTYQKGNLTDTGFESEWLNLRLEVTDDVAMATQEELNILMGIGAEVIYDDMADLVLSFAEMTLVYEMMAKHVSGASVALEVELLPVSRQDMSVEQYLDILVNTAKQANINFAAAETTHTRTLVGEEYTGIMCTSSYTAESVVCQEMLVRKKENRMIVLVLSYLEGQEATGESLLALFEEYDEAKPLPTSVPVADTYEKGILTESGMESRWMNLRFTLPEGMIMATQEEMDEVMLASTGMIYGDNASAFMDYTNFQNVYEMQASGEYGFPIVQIMVEKLAYKTMTEEDYAEALKTSFQMTGDYSSGVTYAIHDTLYSVEIAGEEYLDVAVDVTYDNGITVCQDYCIRKKESRMILIMMSYIEGMESYLGMMIDAFSPYENLCSAAYLGYEPEGGYAEFMDFAASEGITDLFPVLKEIPESNTVLASGGEWYLLMPADDSVKFTVYECILDETTYMLAAGEELLALKAGEPVLLRGNVSDIYPSFMVVITGENGSEIVYTPGLSLRDGSLLVEAGVSDVTVYPEGYPAE